MPLNRAESHTSGARCVGRQFDFAGKTPLNPQNETFAAHGRGRLYGLEDLHDLHNVCAAIVVQASELAYLEAHSAPPS